MPFRFAVSCSLIKCVYLYKTLKKLCNGYSSTLGSIFCFDGVSLCRGSGSDGVTVDNCAIHDVWSGTAGGGGYYFLFNYHVVSAKNSYPANFAFSARCVRYLMKLCLLCIKTLKKLCDWISSDLGSIYCPWNIRCPGALSDLSTSGDCYIHAHWSQTASGGSYYDLGLGEGRAQLYLRKPGYAFSVRCVRRLREIVFIVGSKL